MKRKSKLLKLNGASPTNQEAGVYLVIAAIFILVLVTVVFLALAVGFVTVSETRLQNATNFAALGAIQEFETKNSDSSLTYAQKIEAAKTRANYILSLNPIPGLSGSLGNLEHKGDSDSPATIEFGMWWPTKPIQGNSDPCGGNANYPCFVANPHYPASNYTGTANAAKIRIKTEGGNTLLHPFVSLLGSGQGATLSAYSVGTIIQRCTVLVLDGSLSTTYETHQSAFKRSPDVNSGAGPSSLFTSPPNPKPMSLPFMRTNFALQSKYPPNTIRWIAPFPATNIGACATPPNTSTTCYPRSGSGNTLLSICKDTQAWYWDKIYLCNMIFNCNGVGNECIVRPVNSPIDPTVHYLSDYRSRPSNVDYFPAGGTGDGVGDPLYIDSLEDQDYIGPEPFSRYMLSFNAALRSMASQAVAGDKVAALVVTGAIKDQIPEDGSMSEDLGYLTNLFNWSNRGTVHKNGTVNHAEQHPNAVDRGWPPLFSTNPRDGSTNLVLSLNKAIDILSTSCSDNAQKSIIMAGDGMGVCKDLGGGAYDCATDYDHYLASEDQLLNGSNSILSKLIQSKIALTFILDGAYVQPNIYNIWYDKNNNSAHDADEHYMSMDEARALGYSGIGAPSGKQFFDLSSSVPPPPADDDGVPSDKKAFENAGLPGYVFRRVNGVLGKMSFETGGIFCPVMDPCPSPGAGQSAYYDDDNDASTPEVLRSSLRQEGQMQTCAVQNLTKAQQAAKCAVDTLGRNPYVLVEEAGG